MWLWRYLEVIQITLCTAISLLEPIHVHAFASLQLSSYSTHCVPEIIPCLPPILFAIADFNMKTRDGLTPLLVAAKNNRKNTILWLLQDGAECVDVCAVDGHKRNAIHLAALNPQCQYTIEVWRVTYMQIMCCFSLTTV